jgi:hypothetical protein
MLTVILKLLSTVLAALFGVLALVVEFKDKETHKVTKWGKVALIGVVVSAIVSLTTQILDEVKSKQESDERRLAAEEQAIALARLGDPLAPPQIYVTWALPRVVAGGEAFIASIKDLSAGLEKTRTRSRETDRDYWVSQSDASGKAVEVEVPMTSRYFPDKARSPDLYALIGYPGIEVALIQSTEDLKKLTETFRQYGNRGALDGDYDFTVGFGTTGARTNAAYNAEDRRLHLTVSGTPEAASIQKNGRITSMYDLEGSNIAVMMSHIMVVDSSRDDDTTLRSNRNAAAPRYLNLTANGRDYTIREWKVTESAGGARMFSAGPLREYTRSKDGERKLAMQAANRFPEPQTKE